MFSQKFSKLNDEEWIGLLKRSITEHEIDGVMMPTFPADDLQRGIHGHANETSLNEAYKYFSIVKHYCEHFDRPLQQSAKLVDFGSGWGRIARMFMKDINPKNIIGLEPNKDLCFEARRHNPYIAFLNSPYIPPTLLADSSVDVVTAWSVFTHLPALMVRYWIAEFARFVKPGGLVFLTVQGGRFLTTMAQWVADQDAGRPLSPWSLAIARSFRAHPSASDSFERGEFVFLNTTQSRKDLPALYGDALVPHKFIQEVGGEWFDIIDYFDDDRLPQALFVLRRK